MTEPVTQTSRGDRLQGMSEARRALLQLKMREAHQARMARERIAPAERTGRLPLSFAQQRLWFLDQFAPGLPVYNSPLPLRLRGPLDIDALERALTRVVERHEIMRTRYLSENGVPYQVIDAPPERVSIELVDASDLPPREQEQRLTEFVTTAGRRSFDLANDASLRPSMLRLGPADHVLMLCMHHITTDGWSTGTLTREMVALYSAFAGGGADPLPPLPVQYVDYAVWQRNFLAGEELDRQLTYWTSRLDDLPILDFPTDRPRPISPTWAGSIIGGQYGEQLRLDLTALARASKVTMLTMLYAAFQALLVRYTGQADIVVGSVFSGRTRSEIEALIGFFSNSLVLRTDAGGDPTFRDLLGRTNDAILGAHLYQDLPFGKLVDALKPARDPSRNPLFQISFTLQNSLVDSISLGGLTVELVPLTVGTSRFDFAFQLTEQPGHGFRVWIEYSTEMFDRGRLQRLIRHYENVLQAVVRDPDLRISRLELMDEQERRTLVVSHNATAKRYPAASRCLHALFEKHAAARPDHPAVRFLDGGYSYSQLNARANQLAHRLRELGAGPDRVVGVLLERGLELPVGLLGILKSGGAYLPLDPTYPDNRLAFLVGDAGAVAVVTTTDLAGRLPAGTPRICLDDPADAAVLARAPAENPAPLAGPGNLAYLIYTSGSTGRPKGVLVEHRSVVNFTTLIQRMFGVTPRYRVLQFANPAFDVSVFEIFSCLCGGATLIQAPREQLHDPAALQQLLVRERVTMADIPPTMLALMDPRAVPDLRVLFVGLEPYPGELVNNWNIDGRQFHNGYGPTEATVACVNYHCPAAPLEGSPPIGVPLPNYTAYVLDSRGAPVPTGVPGELHVGGVGVARGYLNRPALTARMFVPDPFGTAPGRRLYRTGDLARWRDDGNLEFLGRVDTQIKIRGLRVEPGEIEHVLTSHPAIAQAVVVAHTDGGGDAALVAYVVTRPDATADAAAVRAHLSAELPPHMIPSAYVVLPSLPLTPNGKLDRAALPRPTAAPVAEFVAATTATELALVEIWRALLAVERIGVNDNFFGLGGNSLQATQLVSRIRDGFNVSVDLRTLFTSATVGQLAELIEEQELAALSEEELDALLAGVEELSEDEAQARLEVRSES